MKRRIASFVSVITVAAVTLQSPDAEAAISLTGPTITENFDGVTPNSSSAALPTDWKAATGTGIRQVGTYASAGTAVTQTGGPSIATGATGGIYNFGSGTDNLGTDRAIGGIGSGTAAAVNLMVQFQNNEPGSLPLIGFNVSYDAEKYRNGSNPAGFSMRLFCSIDGINWAAGGDDVTLSWPADANNNGASTVPVDTKSVSSKNIYLPTQAGNGGYAYLAWNYSATTQSTITNAQGLGIDNVSITPIFANPTGVTVWNNTGGGTISIPGDYTSFENCVSDFNTLPVNGGTGYAINGNWIVELGAGSHTIMSTMGFANSVHPSNGSITIRPANGAAVSLSRSLQAATFADTNLNAVIVIGNNSPNNGNVDLGAVQTDNFTFNGSNGPGSSLSIFNAPGQTGFVAHTISVWGHSIDGAIRNCTINCWTNSASQNHHGVNFAARRSVATSGHDIPNGWEVSNCSITSDNGTQSAAVGCQAFSGSGLVGAVSGLEILNNVLVGRQIGIRLNCTAGATISGNTIRINQQTGALGAGIRHQNCNGTSGWTMTISANKLDQLIYSPTGVSGVNGIYCDSTGPGINSTYEIHNNTIGGFSITGGTVNDKLCRGIFAASGSSATGVTFRVYHNSINMPLQTGSIAGGATEGQSICAIGVNTNSFTLDVKNNLINLAQVGSASNPSSAIFKSSTASSTLSSSGNTIWVSGANTAFGILNGTSATGTKYTTFSGAGATSWQDLAGANQDANGQGNFDPVNNTNGKWVSASDLHFTPTTAPPTGLNFGVAGTSIAADVDGESRYAAKPYPGADEIPGQPVPVSFSMLCVE